jgi:hypothetical protein
MVLKTRLTNISGRDRNYRWAGVRGLYLAPGQIVEVDGAYPTACRNDACKQEMQSDVDLKLVKVVLITDMEVEAPSVLQPTPKIVVNPNPAPPMSKAELTPKVAPKAKAEPFGIAQAFQRGTIESARPAATPFRDVTPHVLEDAPMFPDKKPVASKALVSKVAEAKAAEPETKKASTKKTKVAKAEKEDIVVEKKTRRRSAFDAIK